jgi:hypothetical protein
LAVYGELEIPDADVLKLSDAALVARLVASGKSRVTAYRIVELERQKAEPSRARPHTQSRR